MIFALRHLKQLARLREMVNINTWPLDNAIKFSVEIRLAWKALGHLGMHSFS